MLNGYPDRGPDGRDLIDERHAGGGSATILADSAEAFPPDFDDEAADWDEFAETEVELSSDMTFGDWLAGSLSRRVGMAVLVVAAIGLVITTRSPGSNHRLDTTDLASPSNATSTTISFLAGQEPPLVIEAGDQDSPLTLRVDGDSDALAYTADQADSSTSPVDPESGAQPETADNDGSTDASVPPVVGAPSDPTSSPPPVTAAPPGDAPPITAGPGPSSPPVSSPGTPSDDPQAPTGSTPSNPPVTTPPAPAPTAPPTTVVAVPVPALPSYGSSIGVPSRTAVVGSLGATAVNSNALYVSTSGSDSNDGTSESTAFRTLTRAVASVTAGQTIYVKAGTYVDEHVRLIGGGTASRPIVIEGYRNTPGDNPTIVNFNHTSSLDPTVMPLFDGVTRSGNGIVVSGPYITVRNVQVTRYALGVGAYSANHSLIENVIATDLGNRNLGQGNAYDGIGIALGSSALDAANSAIRNSTVVNSTGEGITLSARNSRVENSRVYADDNSTGVESAMDYYILATGSGNVLANNYAERVGDLAHLGHGIGFPNDATNNLAINNTANGFASESFYCRFTSCSGARFEHNTAMNGSFGFVARDGASSVEVVGAKTENIEYPIVFFAPSGARGGVDISVSDSLFENTTGALVSFSRYLYVSGTTTNYGVTSSLDISNVVVDEAPALFDVGHVGNGISIRNSTLNGVPSLATYQGSHDRSSLQISGSGNILSGTPESIFN